MKITATYSTLLCIALFATTSMAAPVRGGNSGIMQDPDTQYPDAAINSNISHQKREEQDIAVYPDRWHQNHEEKRKVKRGDRAPPLKQDKEPEDPKLATPEGGWHF
ncbi:hypothetical protein BGX26_001946 [Mortierella sp. AD094]|nr:hypothetical protein BGX26_001946 [Mortierella sp. AD094]